MPEYVMITFWSTYRFALRLSSEKCIIWYSWFAKIRYTNTSFKGNYLYVAMILFINVFKQRDTKYLCHRWCQCVCCQSNYLMPINFGNAHKVNNPIRIGSIMICMSLWTSKILSEGELHHCVKANILHRRSHRYGNPFMLFTKFQRD